MPGTERTRSYRLLAVCVCCLTAMSPARAQTDRVLTLNEFVELATHRDTEFEQILINELALQYEKDLRLPPRDIVLSVKQEYVSFLEDSRGEAATLVGLGKLFPFTGTEVTAAYEVRPVADANADAPSSAFITLAQPIARNAFGHSTRLLDKIVGLEVDVARHQIVEAYEDYLATLIVAYYDWWAAYERLRIGESSYRENVRLLDNILERQRQQVALPIDVNKTRIQVLAKKEDLTELGDAYTNSLNVIAQSIRDDGVDRLIPQASPPYPMPQSSFEEAYERVRAESRTFEILDLLERRSELDVDRQADDLLPSINLLFGADIDGTEHELRNGESIVSVGLAVEWPFPNQVDRAEREVAKIDRTRARLETENTHYDLHTRLQNLYLQVLRERELTALAEEKIELAKSVLEDESENYSFGRVTLNDYIAAVNVLDNNRFSRLRHDALEKVLTIEWLRLADSLITREAISSP